MRVGRGRRWARERVARMWGGDEGDEAVPPESGRNDTERANQRQFDLTER